MAPGMDENMQAPVRIGIWEWVLRLWIQGASLKREVLQNQAYLDSPLF